MTISLSDLEQMANLAYLDTDSEQMPQLIEEMNAIINFVDQLRAINTEEIAPLFHPVPLHQRLRADTVTEEDCLAELEALAPLFEEHLYLVPQVIDQAKE